MKNKTLNKNIIANEVTVHKLASAALHSLDDQASELVLVVPTLENSGFIPPYSLGCTVIALSEVLCQRLLPLSHINRENMAEEMVIELIDSTSTSIVWLDRIQVLFEPSLQLDPLRLLMSLARIKPVVATWPGTCSETALSFSAPGKFDYQHYPASTLTNIPVIRFASMETK